MRRMTRRMRIGLLAAAIAVGGPLPAQLLGGGGIGGLTSGLLGGSSGQGGVVGGLQGPLMGVGDTLRALTSGDLLSLRKERQRALLRANRDALDVDDDGNVIRRGEIVAIGLAPDALAKAQAAGFALVRSGTVEGLGLATTILAPPKGEPARKAIAKLRMIDPAGTYTLDHVYEPARAPLAPAKGPAADSGSAGPDGKGAGTRIGLIDGGVGNHPAFAGAHIEQRGFAGAARPSGHGTAVASLIVGSAGAFHGAAPGGTLLVADVYGGAAGNGSADAIMRAMGWMAASGARVVNISLVGPPNPLLLAAVKALQARGIIIVAAVGNDGPAAPPQYPASYPGVVAVTGVDAKGKALFEAGKPLHLDFAAPGADMAGAVPGGGWEKLRGTSFAAPLVTARLARLDRGNADATLAALAAEARPGGGKVGRGIVCGDCAIPPKSVGLK